MHIITKAMKLFSLPLITLLLVNVLLHAQAPTTWVLGTQYNSGSIVGYGDNFYRAIQDVPGSVGGTPDTLTDYWVDIFSTKPTVDPEDPPTTEPDTSDSDLANLTPPEDNATQIARIVSVSVRGTIGAGDDKRIMGFRMNGTADVLLRGVGPALANFGIPSSTLLPDPKITLFRYINGDPAQGSERVLEGDNDNYTSNSNSSDIENVRASYALDIPTNPLQAISMPTLSQGFYTSQVEDVSGETGIGWAGVDFSYPNTTSTSFLHVSTRGIVQTTEYMFSAFQIIGEGTRKLYIRGRGPSLADFGVPGVMPDPIIRVFKYDDDTFASSTMLAENDDYTSNANHLDILSYSTSLYGWPAINEKDPALVMDLGSGYYTVQLISTSTDNDGNGWIGVDDVTE
jgi:hypothetical protein